MTNTSSKKVTKMRCIHYPVWFQESQEQVKALLNGDSEVNAISSTFVRKLGLHIQKINFGAQKIDGSALKIFGIMIADFSVENKVGRPSFFQKTFLVADTKFEMILTMLFLKIRNADMAFDEEILMWKFYITNKALPTTKQV